MLIAQQIPCNCLDNLNETIAKTEINYAGFPSNKNPIDESGFNPDVKLNIPAKQWVEYITKDLKRKN